MKKALRFLLLSLFILSVLAACGGNKDKPEETTPEPGNVNPSGEYVGEVSILGRVMLTIEDEEIDPSDLEAPEVRESQGVNYPAVAVSDQGSVALECGFIDPTEAGYNFSCIGTDTVDSDGDGEDDSAQPISFVGDLVEGAWQGEFLSTNSSPLDFEFQRQGDSPTKPTNVEALPLEDYIEVTWTDNSENETGFIVYRAQGDAVLEEVGRTAPDVTDFRDEDVDVSERYRYAVEATGAGDTQRVEIDTPVSLRARYSLSVARSEQGSIISKPAGLNCGESAADCSADFAEGVKVSVSASAAEGFTFKNWQGACEGASSCTVSMTEDKTLSAVFVAEAKENRLTVLFEGEGRGLVLSESSTLKCDSTCSQTFSENAQLSLSAEPERGFFFQGWGGVCAGQSVCRVDVDKNVLVKATFGRDDVPLPGPEDTGADTGADTSDTGADGAEEDTGADTGATDTGSEDAGSEDTGSEDTGAEDGGTTDTGGETTGEATGADTGSADGADTGTAGTEDTGTEDTGAEDGGAEDDGAEDDGAEDTGGEATTGDSGEDTGEDTTGDSGEDGAGDSTTDTTAGADSADGADMPDETGAERRSG